MYNVILRKTHQLVIRLGIVSVYYCDSSQDSGKVQGWYTHRRVLAWTRSRCWHLCWQHIPYIKHIENVKNENEAAAMANLRICESHLSRPKRRAVIVNWYVSGVKREEEATEFATNDDQYGA
jgi:hypothetical protein